MKESRPKQENEGERQRMTRFFAASALTNLGDGIATISWAWAASLLTRDPLLIALVAMMLRLPWAIFALVAGVVTDRLDRRKLILQMDVLRSLAFALTAFVLWTAMPLPAPSQSGVSSIPAFAALVIAAFTVGAAEVFRDNAAQTMLPSLVPHDRLEVANGRLWSFELTGNALIGPPLGAFLVAISVALPFLANTAAYGLGALFVAGIAGSFSAGKDGERNWRKELSAGISFLKESPLLRLLAWLTGWWNLFFQMVMIALVLHVQDNMNLTSTAYGLILAAGSVGGIAGGLLGERIVRKIGPKATAQWMLFASVPSFAGIALAPGPYTLAIVLAAFEFSGLVWNTVSVSTRQRMIPNHLLGRVNSVYRLVAWGMMPLGLLLSGLVVRGAEIVTTREFALTTPFWISSFGVLAVTVIGWRPLGIGLTVQSDDRHHTT